MILIAQRQSSNIIKVKLPSQTQLFRVPCTNSGQPHQTVKTSRLLTILVPSVLVPAFASAEDIFFDDGGTHTLTSLGSYSTPYEDLVVGTGATDNTTLTLDGLTFTLSGKVSVGGNTGGTLVTGPQNRISNDNTLNLVGTSLTLQNNNTLSIGAPGDNNTMNVDANSSVTVKSMIIGYSDAYPVGSTPGQTFGGNAFNLNGGTLTMTHLLYVGFSSGNNSLNINSGATANIAAINIGNNSSGTGNSVVITGSGTRVVADEVTNALQGATAGYINVGSVSGSNTYTQSAGAYVHTSVCIIGGSNGNSSSNNLMTVTGVGTRLDIAPIWDEDNSQYIGGSITIGYSASSQGNILLIDGGALVTLDGTLTVTQTGTASENLLRIGNGLLAIKAADLDAATLLFADVTDGTGFEVFKDGNWVSATVDDYAINWYADDSSGFLATGYNGLGGFGVLTNVHAVPEPAEVAGLAGLAVLFVALRRRKIK